MKILKRILLTIAIIIAMALITALFVKKDFAMERTIVVNKPKAEVFSYLKSLKNQDEWSVWAKLDPNMHKEFVGEDGTVGCISKWDGNDDVGSGEQEIKAIKEGERIETELRFLKPFKTTNQAYLVTEMIDSNSTTVKWGFTGKMPYPFNLMRLFMDMDKTVGKDFEEGLKNLKAKLD